MGAPQISFFVYYVEAPLRPVSLRPIYGGTLRSISSLTIWGPPDQFLRYYMGVLAEQFLRLLNWGPLRSVSSHNMGGPTDHFSLTIWGHLRSVSSHTIWTPPQTCFFAYCMGPPPPCQLLRLLYRGSPQVSFFAYYMGAPSDSGSGSDILFNTTHGNS